MNVLAPRQLAAAATNLHASRPAIAIVSDTADTRLVVFRLAPGQQVPPHRNASTVMLSVLEGSGILSGEHDGVVHDVVCMAGDLVVYEPNELHSMRAVDTELYLLATITPRPGERGAI